MTDASFLIVESGPDVLLIRDVGPWEHRKTITNDAESVVERLRDDVAGRRLEYLDSRGERHQIVIRDGRFDGFAPPGVRVILVEQDSEVRCDFCDADFTDSEESGGVLFQSKAVCPRCVPKLMRDVVKWGEERFLCGECPEGVPFAVWVRAIRGR